VRRAPYLDFSLGEYRQRLSAIRRAMEEQAIDGLVLTMRESLEFISGFQDISVTYPFKQFFLVVSASDEPYLIVDELHRATARGTSWTENVETWGGKGDTHMDAIYRVIEEAGLSKKRVGMELGPSMRLNMTQLDYERFRKRFSEMEVVDASDLLRSVRRIKSEEELKRIRKASAITVEAWKACFEGLREGMTEKEFLNGIEIEMLKRGADPGYNRVEGVLHVSSGDRMKQYGSVPVERPIKKGDFIRLDGCATYRRYVCDMTRSFYFGEPPNARNKRLMDALIGAHARILEVVRPGVRSAEIVAAVLKVFKEQGVEKQIVRWYTVKTGLKYIIGHNLGFVIHEEPYIVEGGQSVWEEKMVFASELILSEFEEENTYEVTKDGCRLLTPLEHKSAFLEGEPWKLG
jgi:Xaa-Pro dipeptidase